MACVTIESAIFSSFQSALAATFHVTDTADSVYDGLVVPETRLLVV